MAFYFDMEIAAGDDQATRISSLINLNVVYHKHYKGKRC